MSIFDGLTGIINQTRSVGTYVSVVESVRITNGIAQLREIPDKASGIVLTNGGTTYGVADFTLGQLPIAGVISVDWNQGFIYGFSDVEGLNINASYQGTGGLFISASRVASIVNAGTVVQTLSNIIGAGVGSWTFKGSYNNTTAYVPNNVITYQGNAYICLVNSTGNLPSNNIYWQIFVASGSVSSVTSANSDISVINTTSTPILTANSGTGANQIPKRDANGIIQNAGSQITAKSTNATLLLSESGIIDVTTAATTITITLPSAVTTQVSYIIKKIDSGAGSITISTSSSQLIDGVSTKSITYQYGYIQVISDGTGWQIVDGSTNVTSANPDISISNGISNPVLTLNSSASVVNNAIVKRDGSGNIAGNILGNSATVTTNANLTGMVTSVGNATTVVTNANLTGEVTSVGNTTTIANVGTGANQLPKRDANGNIQNIGYQIIPISASTTLTLAQSGIVNVTTGASVITLTLPTAIGNAQLVYTLKKADSGSGTVSIATTASQTIDGVTTKTLTNQYADITIVSDGSNWLVDVDNSYDKLGILSNLTTTNKVLVPAINEVQQMPVNTMSRQALINPNMEVVQTGTSFTNPANNTYTLDMWVNLFTNTGTLPTTIIHTQNTLTAGELFNSYYSYQVNVNGAGSGFGVSDAYGQAQRIEFGTSRLCGNGKKVTISFFVKSSIATKRIAVGLKQVYGTGGSPTAAEILTPTATTIRSLTTTMAQYTFTFTTNTLTGKTFGTNNDDYLELAIYEMWGSTFSTNNLGGGTAETFVGSGNINFTQAVLNAGDTALSFQPKSFGDELLSCLRFYRKSYAYAVALGTITDTGAPMKMDGALSTGYHAQYIHFEVQMRSIPTILYWDRAGNASKITTLDASATPTHNVVPSAPPGEITERSYRYGHNANVSGISLHYAADARL